MHMLEAFRALNALNEDIFSLDADGIDKLSNFTQNDDLEDDVQIIDPEAETEDDLQDNYIGKVILDCCVCHSKLYKDPSEVDVDETGELANVGEECPYCFTPDGFKVIGEVVAFTNKAEPEEEVEDNEDTPDTDDHIEESYSRDLTESVLNEGRIGDMIKKAATRVGADAATIVRAFSELIGGKAEDIATHIENKAVLKALQSGNKKVMNTLTQDDIEDLVADIAAYENGSSDEVEEGLIGDINVPINLDASGSSVGFLGGTAGGIKNESLEEGAFNGGQAEGGFRDTSARPGGSTSKLTHDTLKGKNTRTVKAKDLKPGMVTNTGKIQKVNKTWSYGRPAIEVSYGGIGNRGSYASDTVAEDKEYEVLDESINESIDDLSMTANDTHIEVSEEENGKVTVSMEPATNDAGGEVIAAVSPEAEAEIMADEVIEDPVAEEPIEDIPADEEVPEEGADSEVDADFDEFDEESMDGLGESYFKKVYENVNSFKTTAVKTSGNSMIIEGLLEFDSGNKKNTSFIFEALDATKTGKFRFVGDNKELTEGKKAFMLTGTINNNKLIVESMNYNYKHIDAEGKTSRVYGTERIRKGE